MLLFTRCRRPADAYSNASIGNLMAASGSRYRAPHSRRLHGYRPSA